MPLLKSLPKKSYWKLNTSLLTDCKFDNEFRVYYSMWRTLKPGFASIKEWWENVKMRIRELGVIHGVRRAREKRDLLIALQSRCLEGDTEDVERILLEEQRGAFVRSREKVLEKGEIPSGYFYTKERNAAEAKQILSVKGENGNIVSGDNVRRVFQDFYTKLYSTENDIDVECQSELLNCIKSKVADADRLDLDRPLSS
ncbi:hypothetical protein HOLleu_42429 [Holothuria leucospilota]|uniref:Uncharacterized protein n=1 Tax=Holothuria leucospilota TaxID=206669 RepID=A0A9Q0YCV5_HOLLE|nr:hypothetical protein HOLleu_42429 [Holothuria leucospilota]